MARVPTRRGLRPTRDNAGAHYANYQPYNAALRNWLVSFGYGGLAVFLVNDKLAGRLKDAGVFEVIVACLFIGSTAQIVLAFLNKYIAWHSYDAAEHPGHSDGWSHRLLGKMTNSIWLDIACDVISLGLFGCVIAVMIYVLFATPTPAISKIVWSI